MQCRYTHEAVLHTGYPDGAAHYADRGETTNAWRQATDRTYLEKNLPASLDKALREYIQGEKDKVSYMDCLWGELYSAINSNQWSNAITQEQADYLRTKYL